MSGLQTSPSSLRGSGGELLIIHACRGILEYILSWPSTWSGIFWLEVASIMLIAGRLCLKMEADRRTSGEPIGILNHGRFGLGR